MSLKRFYLLFAVVMTVFLSVNFASAETFPEKVFQFGSSAWDAAYKVVVDKDGNAYVGGVTQGSMIGSSRGGADAFIRKYTAQGAVAWTITVGSSGNEELFGMAVGKSGDLYVTGNTMGNVTRPVAGAYDFFVARYRPDGTLVWIDQYGTAAVDRAFSLALDADDNAYVAGYTKGSMDGVTDPKAYSDAFIMKYSADGTRLWVRQFETSIRPLDDYAYGLACYGGHLYVTGLTRASEIGNLFLLKYDLDGRFVWKRTIGGENTHGKSLAADATGVHVAGLSYLAAFDGNAYIGDRDAILIKYDHDGNKLWSKQWGTRGYDEAAEAQIDASGNVYVAGSAGYAGCVGAGCAIDGINYFGATDGYLRKFTSAGEPVYTKQFGTAGQDYVYSVALGPTGRIYLAGATESLLGNARSGGVDAFLAAYPSDIVSYVVNGFVKDIAGPALPDVDIVVSDSDNNVVKATKSDPDGKFTFETKVPGVYWLAKKKTGYVSKVDPEDVNVASTPLNITTYMLKLPPVCFSLQPGWNTVVFPRLPADYTVEGFFGSNIKHIQNIWVKVDGGKTLKWDKNAGKSDFNAFEAGKVYSVHSSRTFEVCRD